MVPVAVIDARARLPRDPGLAAAARLARPRRRHRGDLRRGVRALVAGAARVGPPGERRGSGRAGGRPGGGGFRRHPLIAPERPPAPGTLRAMPSTAVNAPERVLLAAPRGYCAGVDRAVQTVEHALELHGPPVYVRKEIVHNKHVVEELTERGAIFVDQETEVPEGALVVFSAHGVSPAVHENSAKRNLRTIDATCPLVTKVHVEARRFAEEGFTIILVGHDGHEEVEGTTGEAPDSIVLVESAEDVDALEVDDPDRVALITQTTLSVDETADIIARLREKFPNITTPKSDDICYATTNRQLAVKQLAQRVRAGPRGRLEELLELEPPRRRDPRARHRVLPDRQRRRGPGGVARGRRHRRHHLRGERARGAGHGAGRVLPRARPELAVEEVRAIDEDVRFMLPSRSASSSPPRAVEAGVEPGGISSNCGAWSPIWCQLALYATCWWKLGSMSRSLMRPSGDEVHLAEVVVQARAAAAAEVAGRELALVADEPGPRPSCTRSSPWRRRRPRGWNPSSAGSECNGSTPMPGDPGPRIHAPAQASSLERLGHLDPFSGRR